MATTTYPSEFPIAEELAAFRGVMKGMSTRDAVDRYLAKQRPPGASSRSTITAIRRRLIIIARERHKSELVEVFSASPTSRISSRVDAAIETLRVAKRPRPLVTDDVEQWFAPRVVNPLRAAEIRSVADIVVRVAHSPKWWKHVTGLGRVAGEQVEQFVREHPELLSKARTVVPINETPLLPWEQLRAPKDLDGSRGVFRGPRATSVLAADNDYHAVQAWLELHESAPTQRAYRKEAERLMLWAIVERSKALSSLTTEDAIAYRAFLRNPSPRDRWIGRVTTRNSAAWRPFQGPLSSQSASYALQVVTGLFRWLVEQRYLLANPFSGVKIRGKEQSRSKFSSRSFNEHEWELISSLSQSAELQMLWSDAAIARLQFTLDFCYGTGLRSSEMVSATLGKLSLENGTTWIEVSGKGAKKGKVVVPPVSTTALDRYLVFRGLPLSSTRWIPSTPLVPNLENDSERLTANRLWQIVQRFFAFAANSLKEINPVLAEKLSRASPHWMRHTHATHALNRGVDLHSVRDNLRHASIATTSIYLHTDDQARGRQMTRAFAGGELMKNSTAVSLSTKRTREVDRRRPRDPSKDN